MYQVIYTAKAVKSLKKIDKTQALFILNWIEKNLVGCSDPRAKGRAIRGNLADWRYRVGDYRLLCNILDREIIIEVINVGHRKEIYK
ncbi:plasmid stabilization system protein [Ignatzschineria indica]|uniref:Type II toxin-antitoxin system mRNA interferase toxin, RelE/StbE family n=1 Tax=Ignatzschineria indica TaxID=472583 RepID=A0A2U2AIW1_9GAMM|nr:type II toxin-antitoxin system RelE/ParE family toxin [Ignatzschineria indica]PWD82610.1 type II toxin-antitoxin system mRNA interferase toxin, RelE/StbE family [Ignatzschineria indica]GGZ85294.1 plasmid stabilization system protein [Ignatzschineria indica]